MSTEELAQLLTRITVLDNRQVDRLTLEAWEPIIGDLPYQDAVAAVNDHFRTPIPLGQQAVYLAPGHIVERVAQIARARARGEVLAKPCHHHFDETSGYCVRCGIREDHAA